jgi:hypothetical protein
VLHAYDEAFLQLAKYETLVTTEQMLIGIQFLYQNAKDISLVGIHLNRQSSKDNWEHKGESLRMKSMERTLPNKTWQA